MEQFEKIKSIGRGAQGTVILVRRKADKSKFCIKKVYIEDQSPEDQEEVMNEIKVLAQLAHPNIVAYFGSFVDNEDLNVVMEYADGGTLHQHIQKSKNQLSEADIMKIFVQLLLCLDYLHSKKILHRDLKTKNIFMTKKLQVKLGDFGLSRMMGSQTDFAQSAVGTPYYLSPELCEGRRYNHKSDVWALGCVLYEMSTMKHAFDATNLPALVMAIVQQEHEPLAATYSTEFRQLVDLMLCKDPEQRPDIPGLLELDIVKSHMAAFESSAEKAAFELDRMQQFKDKPFFAHGQVESVVTQSKRGDRSATTDQVLKEVQEEQEFTRLITHMRKALNIQDRVIKRVPYFKTFVAKDLVNFICDQLGIQSREEATKAAEQWMDAGVFYHVNRNQDFVDGDSVYRFREDEVGSILNMKVRWTGPSRAEMDVESDFRQNLVGLVDNFTCGEMRRVDYEGLAVSHNFSIFQATTTELQVVDLLLVSFNLKIAFYVNLYNALLLHGFIVIGPPSTVHQRIYFFNHTCYTIGGQNYCLNDIEHGLLRGNQKPPNSYARMFPPSDPRTRAAVVVWDPRIHFALVRGSKSCPVLRVYDPERLDDMLNTATREFCCTWVELVNLSPDDQEDISSWSLRDMKVFLQAQGVETRHCLEKQEFSIACKTELEKRLISGCGQRAEIQVNLPMLFHWYYEDFGSTDESLLLWIKQYVDSQMKTGIDKAIEQDNYIISYIPFDWSLNKKPRILEATE